MDSLVTLHGAVETMDLLGRHQIKEVFDEVGAGELTGGPLSARSRRSNVGNFARLNGGNWPVSEVASRVAASRTPCRAL